MIEIKGINYPEGKRIRQLTDWGIVKEQDDQGSFIRLTGIVKEGINEVPLAPGANLRYTTTSPIKTITNHTVITQSGSIYFLYGLPHKTYINLLNRLHIIYDNECPITQEVMNALLA